MLNVSRREFLATASALLAWRPGQQVFPSAPAPQLRNTSTWVTMATWNDAPHLPPEWIEEVRRLVPRDQFIRRQILSSPSVRSKIMTTREEKFLELSAIKRELALRASGESTLAQWFPDTGPLRRELYPRHLEFFEKGLDYKTRVFLAANQIGKTTSGCYEDTVHSTGLYPAWWNGRVFTTPTTGWVIGETAKSVRDTIQVKLFGEKDALGTGLLPAECIIRTTPKHGLSDAIDTAYIRHVSGGISKIVLKSYKEEVDSFRSAVIHWIHADEEPTLEILSECITRLLTTRGSLYLTLTPLKGRTELIDKMLREAANRDFLPIAA